MTTKRHQPYRPEQAVQAKARRQKRKEAGEPTMTEKTRETNAERYKRRKAAGLLPYKYKPKTEAQRNWRPHTPEQIARARAAQDARNAADREKRRLAKAGKPDFRRKEHRIQPHYKQAIASVKPSPEKQVKVERLKTNRKPEKQAQVIQIKSTPIDQLVAVRIDRKTVIYIKPDRDPEQARANYIAKHC